jgi:hypothetical protein
MQSNRIQHFLYTNNIPTGLNYQTDILMSLIHIEGSEYPYSLLPNNLPVYVGDLRDSLTKMMTGNNDFVSQECLDQNWQILTYELRKPMKNGLMI